MHGSLLTNQNKIVPMLRSKTFSDHHKKYSPVETRSYMINQKQTQQKYVALVTLKILLLTTLRKLWKNTEEIFFLSKMYWHPLMKFCLKWPRPKMKTGSSCKSNRLFMNKIFTFHAIAINFYSTTSNIILFLIMYLLYFNESW